MQYDAKHATFRWAALHNGNSDFPAACKACTAPSYADMLAIMLVLSMKRLGVVA